MHLSLRVMSSSPTLGIERTLKKKNSGGPEPPPSSPVARSHPHPHPVPAEVLYYTDDTAMARALVQSLLAKEAFDEVDMAHR